MDVGFTMTTWVGLGCLVMSGLQLGLHGVAVLVITVGLPWVPECASMHTLTYLPLTGYFYLKDICIETPCTDIIVIETGT